MLEGITEFLANLVISWISLFGYVGIFFVVVLESIIIPIPSEFILPFAGFLVYQGTLDFVLVIIAATAGSIVSSIISYYIGFLGGRPFLRKYGKYMFVTEKEIEKNDKWFKKHGHSAVFFGRMIPGIRSLISIPAGIAKMEMKKFLTYTTLGSLPWNIALVYLGFVLGEQWGIIGQYMDILDIIVIIAIIVVAIYLIYKWKFKPKK